MKYGSLKKGSFACEEIDEEVKIEGITLGEAETALLPNFEIESFFVKGWNY